MDEWPDEIRTEEELDEVLTRPSPQLAEFMRRLEGDVLVLGAGGKMGPTLCVLARRALQAAGSRAEVIAVARRPLENLRRAGVRTLECDLLDPAAVQRLPRTPNVIFMAGRKFGSTGDEAGTWATNVIVPYHVARTFTESRIVAFSTGCVYALMPDEGNGATEDTPPDPVGEYSMSCLGRERMFDYFSRTRGERVLLFRLNYATELRYGVPVDVAAKVWQGRPVDLGCGYANVIWQGDACERALLALEHAAAPAVPLNVTGPWKLAVRDLAATFGRILGREPVLAGRESGRSYLASAARSVELFGPPRVPLETIIRWTAAWVRRGGRSLGKPTHFEVVDGKF
ncbi:MAG: NAD-dependent epimerase/dehydratase family protein [Planctomycetes bacterium]|nr:NAD-dependent epimerase/dehydratase family protein [Planctomycetota bacterium]